jgi:hypothetical protein
MISEERDDKELESNDDVLNQDVTDTELERSALDLDSGAPKRTCSPNGDCVSCESSAPIK